MYLPRVYLISLAALVASRPPDGSTLKTDHDVNQRLDHTALKALTESVLTAVVSVVAGGGGSDR